VGPREKKKEGGRGMKGGRGRERGRERGKWGGKVEGREGGWTPQFVRRAAPLILVIN